jgi:hypothetical protein
MLWDIYSSVCMYSTTTENKWLFFANLVHIPARCIHVANMDKLPGRTGHLTPLAVQQESMVVEYSKRTLVGRPLPTRQSRLSASGVGQARVSGLRRHSRHSQGL